MEALFFFCHQAITKEVHQDPEARRTKRVALGGVATLPGQCTIPCLRESYASIFAVFQQASGYRRAATWTHNHDHNPCVNAQSQITKNKRDRSQHDRAN